MKREKKLPSVFKREAVVMIILFFAITVLGFLAALLGPYLWKAFSH
jgi:heme A synthase